jgi:hypothetical protein
MPCQLLENAKPVQYGLLPTLAARTRKSAGLVAGASFIELDKS